MTQAWIRALTAALVALVALPAGAGYLDPTGVWLMEKNEVAIRVYECDDGLCGRIVWLEKPLDKQGQPKRDKRNPDAGARDRPLCGVQVLTGLRPAGGDRWEGGTIYNPEDGKTYTASIRLADPDTLKVRGYVGISLLGKTRTLTRVRERADGPAGLALDTLPAAQDGLGQNQVAGLIDIDRGFGEGQFDGPGCRPNQARQAPQRGIQG